MEKKIYAECCAAICVIFVFCVSFCGCDILEPHGSQYADNLPKAKGLAEYARTESIVGRVQLIRKVNDRLLRLDLCKGEIRDRVLSAMCDDDLFAIFDKFGYREEV